MPRVHATILVGQIIMDRIPLDPTTLKYANLIKNGVDFPAIKVQWLAPGRFMIKDGRHRWAAHRLAGCKRIKVKYGEVPQEDPHRGCREYLLEKWGRRSARISQRNMPTE